MGTLIKIFVSINCRTCSKLVSFLKVPKRKIFVSYFTLSNPIWVGDFGTKQKKNNFLQSVRLISARGPKLYKRCKKIRYEECTFTNWGIRIMISFLGMLKKTEFARFMFTITIFKCWFFIHCDLSKHRWTRGNRSGGGEFRKQI